MTQTRLWEDNTVVDSGLTVQVLTQPAINYALVHNKVPVIAGVRVVNETGAPAVDVTVTVRLHGNGAELAPAWTRTHDGDLANDSDVFWDDFAQFAPDTAYLKALDESHPATISVEIARMWAQNIHFTVPIKVLAHNEWFNAPIFYDLLASFVQPNTSAVQSVLDGAAELLRSRTGDASISGYQGGQERAAWIAAAIYETLRTKQIRYITPPASFENTGQKIRTTAQVLDQRFGTCIDLSVTYAACLEAAGLRPLLWLLDDHAFAGFLSRELTLPHPSLTEPNAMINLVESGDAVPVEAVYYDSSPAASFPEAIERARRHFSTPGKLAGVIGVAAARKSGVLPLPSADDAGPNHASVPAATVGVAALDLPDELRAAPTNDDVLDTTDDAPPRVRRWKRALLDLSTRNRLLNLRPSAQVIDLHVPARGLPVLDDIIHAGSAITLAPHDDLSSIHQLQGARRAADMEPEVLRAELTDEHRIYAAVPLDTYARRLKNLARTARTMLEETGSSNLYLTLGALIHRTSTGAEARAPLFLLPVKIIGGAGRQYFQIIVDTTEVASPNHCLVEWLRHKHNVYIEPLASPILDHSGLDITETLRGIRAALVENNVDLRIDEIATLSICQFSTFGMWKDLNDSWETLEQSPLVGHLAYRPGESFRDPAAAGQPELDVFEVDEAAVPVPIPADGSQLRAIAAAAEGRTFVLEGPPGTGKSQTITNLIAHALGLGKTVLFVAEKQAALDVVKRRLDKVGLQDFTLDLHGKSQTANAIRAQLKAAIDNSLIYNDRSWQMRLSEYRARLLPLSDYPKQVHERNAVDHSVWTAFEEILEAGDGPIAEIPFSYVTRPAVDWDEVKQALEQFARSAHGMDIRPGVAWSITGSIPADISEDQVSAALQRTAAALKTAASNGKLRALLERLDDPAHIAVILPAVHRQHGHQVPDDAALAWLRGPQFGRQHKELFAELERFHHKCAPVLAKLTPSFIESGDVAHFAAEADAASKGVFGKKKRAEQLQHDLAPFAQENADLTPATVLPLLRMIPVLRGELVEVRRRAATLFGPWLPPAWNPLSADCTAELRTVLEYIGTTVAFADSNPAEWQLLTSVGFPSQQEAAILQEVHDAWAHLRSCLGTTDDDLQRWKNCDRWLASWERTAAELLEDSEQFNARQIFRWSRMTTDLAPLRRAGLAGFVRQLLTGAIAAPDAANAFMRGTARTSLEERRRSAQLTKFSPEHRDGAIADFVASAENLRKEQTKALPAALLHRRPFQANALSGDIGQLRRMLDAKRGGASFRQLMQRYADHILAATPCVFVSPASLAQFIPPGSATFDIVVFDEASQVTVAQAIGALGRGRSAVIVGDSQQMPPTSFGQVTAADDNDADEDGELVVDDLDSILTECVESQVPRLWLSWHYRSQDESLIHFSNEKYYEGKLFSLPSPGGDVTAGVEWRRVDGHFNRESRKELRTNRVEAETIVAEIRERLATPHLAGQSIGVVTFNAQQRDLIQDLLEDCDDPLVREQLRPDAEEGIFVKNLENVQGDERDVILFSAAFSPKPGERQLPLNFGPLSRTGGEKRFNVAITRARRKVVIVTSFDPADIDLARTKSVGMHHLRGYLEAAARGPEIIGDARGDTATGPIQQNICAALRERGYVVETNYGLSEFVLDLVVKEPGCDHWQVAIVLDGPRWANRPTVADRELSPQLLETMMHWGAALRVWLPQWIEDPRGVLERVDSAVEAARQRRREFEAQLAAAAAARQAQIAETAAHADLPDESADGIGGVEEFASAEPAEIWMDDSPEPEGAVAGSGLATAGARTLAADIGAAPAEAARLAKAVPTMDPGIASSSPDSVRRDWHGKGVTYLCAPTTPLGAREDLDRINSREVTRVITDAVRELVEVEGPIELDRLARTIGTRFGYDRVRQARKDFITGCVPAELVHSDPLGADFVWPRQLDRATWRGYRTTPDDVARPLHEIAPEEIINAMNAVCGRRELDEEALMRKTLAVFNQRRLASASRDRLSACIDAALGNGRLIRIGSLIRAGS
ncbi:DUF3320 domain-containing protein [Nocardia cyriacigeorgica]|uniref:DUF3320 domain-containing protein n=1 Tax=Nocardia cyriacigeorgica TaxID=135487 RepID=A0A5R8P605_9NOCA|nr:DUF3320 domain-containing protein [Nocardia cyriacigeorgica]TLF93668.1 DUF3320 domain-containing protein [Nocardia cyriacigeorgica]